ncbi:MAG: caspase family protein [Crocinitomicaceae bacterium]
MKYVTIILSCLFLIFLANAEVKPQVVFTAGHTTQVNAMVVSDNTKFLASAGNNKLVKIWDMASSKEFRTLTGTDGRVGFLAFKEDNRTLLAISSEDEMIAWNVVTGEKLFETPAEGSLKIAAFFIPNSSKILYIDEDGILCSFDSKSKQKKVLNESLYCTNLNVDFKNKRVIVSNHLNEITVLNTDSYSVIKTITGSEGNSAPLIPSQISQNGQFLVTVMVDNSVQIIDLSKGKVIFNKDLFGKHIHSLVADPKKPYVYIGVASKGIVAYDYSRQRIVAEIADDIERSDFGFNGLAVFPKNEILITSNMNLIQLYNLKAKEFFKRFEPKAKSIIDMSYDQNDKFLAIARAKGTVEIWDLSQNKVVLEVAGLFPCEFNPDGSKLVVMNNMLNMVEYDTKSWKITGTYKTSSKLNSLLTFSDDGKYLAAGGYMPNTIIYNTSSKESVYTVNHPTGIRTFDFHPTKSHLAYSDLMGNCNVVDFKTNKVIFNHSVMPDIVGGVRFSSNSKHFGIVTWGKKIKLFDANSFSLIKEWEGHSGNINGLDFNKSGKVLMTYATNQSVYSTDNSIMFWNLNGEKITKIDEHKSGVNRAFFDKKADYVFSASDDGSIMINSYKEEKVLATLLATNLKEFIIYTHDNYYMAAKDALSSIAFRVGENLVPFEQYDINLNRPDLVGKAIGKTPNNLIDAYHYLYRKRLRKYNLDEGSIKIDFNLPYTKIENTIPITTDKNTVEFSIKAWDDKYPIKQINIYVNNSPVYGEEGIRPKSGSDPLSFRFVANVALLEGKNKIDISCINANGTESLYATKEISKSGQAQANDFYIATIGVSKYKDERYNLTYPTKDATEIAEAIQFDNKQYETVHVKSLLDEQVTIENIRALTQFFASCKPGDVAAIFIAGHGLLDENFDYFFGTYNIDFANPSTNGLPYAEITKLLNSIKAYQKLLIMDTCHSGELDKEEVKETTNVEVESGDIQFRSVGSAISVENAFGTQNMTKLSADLFSDTRKGTGATVISSAGGAEYAIESDEWQNGLFTYNFIKGFKERKADANGDGLIQISEIRAYVNKQVAEMSNNKQKPTAREENIAVDIVIY